MWEFPSKYLFSGKPGTASEEAVPEGRALEDELALQQDIARRVPEGDLQDFLLSRLAGLQAPVDAPATRILLMVDFLDELESLSVYPPAERAAIGEIADQLRALLKTQGVELLRSADWTPALQRAVKVNRVLAPGAFPIVTRSFSTGVRIGSQLLRKQEVELDMPAESSSVSN